MRNTIDYNSTPLGFLSRFCDLILLNLYFLISCLPVFTIGAAISGMYYVNLKSIRGESCSVWRAYWKGFRSCFKQATLFWLLFLGICCLLAIDWLILPVMLPDFYRIPRLMLFVVFLFSCSMLIYLLPIVARFVCTGKQAIKNALLMVAGYFPWTVLLLLIHCVIPVLCCLSEIFFLYASCIYLICGFSILNLISSHIFYRISKYYETI